MLDSLITSKTRIKLLLKFFLNSNNQGYLRNLEQEFDESTNAIRIELNRFVQAGLLVTENEGNKKMYRANTRHPLFKDLHSIMCKYIGVEQIVTRVVDRLGTLQRVYLGGRLARGLDSDIIDVVLVGEKIDHIYLGHLVKKAEPVIGRRIRYIILNDAEALSYYEKNKEEMLLIYNHK